MKKIAFLIAALLILMPTLMACGGKAGERVVSYEIDPTKISTASTAEERMNSFVSILNEKTAGFSKVVGKQYKPEEQEMAYFLMVYGDVGDDEEKFIDNVKVVIKQLFSYSVRFVAQDAKAVVVQYVFPNGDQGAFIIEKENIAILRNSPPETWKTLVIYVPLVLYESDKK